MKSTKLYGREFPETPFGRGLQNIRSQGETLRAPLETHHYTPGNGSAIHPETRCLFFIDQAGDHFHQPGVLMLADVGFNDL
jgi:hypothetical protein